MLGAPGEPEERVFHLPRALGTIETTLRTWAEEAKVDKHLTFHVSRHTFATLALTHLEQISGPSKE